MSSFLQTLSINFAYHFRLNKQFSRLHQSMSSIPPFSQVVIGFGNSKGQTTTRLLSEQAEKINRVNIKSNFGANPKITIKPIPEISLAPFTQMIYRKRDETILRELINSMKTTSHSIDLQKIKKSAQEQYQELAGELELLKNMADNNDSEEVKKIVAKTQCSEGEARKYLQSYKTVEKAVETWNMHKKMIDEVVLKFKCNRKEAKQFLEASNYDMNLIG